MLQCPNIQRTSILSQPNLYDSEEVGVGYSSHLSAFSVILMWFICPSDCVLLVIKAREVRFRLSLFSALKSQFQ